MRVSRSQVAVLAVGSLAVLWVLGLVFGLSWMYGQKVAALVGQTKKVVEHQLGPPTRDWAAADFRCAEEFPCAGAGRGGPVFLYEDGRRGYYLYFDTTGELASVQAVTRR